MKLQNALTELKKLGYEDCELCNLDENKQTWYEDEFPVSYAAIQHLDTKTKYINMGDKEGDQFAVGCYGSLKAWALKVLDWADSDGYIDCADEDEEDIGQPYVFEMMNEFNPRTLIDLINDIWQIEIIKLED